MSEVKRYVAFGKGVKMVEFEHGAWISESDYDAALADMQHWRDLALQFDNHRMTALWHLKTLAVNPSYAPAVSEFLASPPLPASEIVQRLTAAELRNAELINLLEHAYGAIDENDGWKQLCQRILAVIQPDSIGLIKPTESGASE